MNEIRYAKLQKDYEKWVNQVQSPKILIGKLEQFKEQGLEYFNNKILEAFQHTNKLYQATFNRLKKVGANLSNHQESLEAYLN